MKHIPERIINIIEKKYGNIESIVRIYDVSNADFVNAVVYIDGELRVFRIYYDDTIKEMK